MKARMPTSLEENGVDFVSYDAPLISKERKIEIEKNLKDTSELFNNFGKSWFLGGGLSVDLATGGLKRDHDDIDIFLHQKDAEAFFKYGFDNGYQFLDMRDKTKVFNSSQELKGKRDIFLYKSDKEVIRKFDVIFLRSDLNNNVVFDPDNRIVFSKELYETPQKHTIENGQEIPLIPLEEQFVYKLFEGRLKDFYDIRQAYPFLSLSQRNRINSYLSDIGAVFEIVDSQSGEKRHITTIEELINLPAETVTNIIKHKRFEGFDENIDKVFMISKNCANEAELRASLNKEFGPNIMGIKGIEQIIQELVNKKDTISQDEFRKFSYKTLELVTDLKIWKMQTKI